MSAHVQSAVPQSYLRHHKLCAARVYPFTMLLIFSIQSVASFFDTGRSLCKKKTAAKKSSVVPMVAMCTVRNRPWSARASHTLAAGQAPRGQLSAASAPGDPQDPR